MELDEIKRRLWERRSKTSFSVTTHAADDALIDFMTFATKGDAEKYLKEKLKADQWTRIAWACLQHTRTDAASGNIIYCAIDYFYDVRKRRGQSDSEVALKEKL